MEEEIRPCMIQRPSTISCSVSSLGTTGRVDLETKVRWMVITCQVRSDISLSQNLCPLNTRLWFLGYKQEGNINASSPHLIKIWANFPLNYYSLSNTFCYSRHMIMVLDWKNKSLITSFTQWRAHIFVLLSTVMQQAIFSLANRTGCWHSVHLCRHMWSEARMYLSHTAPVR